MGRIRIGLSGWSYPEWRGDVYPSSLPRTDELGHISRRVDTLEVNATFWSLASPNAVARWYAATPPDHVLAVKGSRFITTTRAWRTSAPRSPTTSRPGSWSCATSWARRCGDGDEPDDARRITDRSPPQRVGRDVDVYFNNDNGGHAPRNAQRLRELVDG